MQELRYTPGTSHCLRSIEAIQSEPEDYSMKPGPFLGHGENSNVPKIVSNPSSEDNDSKTNNRRAN